MLFWLDQHQRTKANPTVTVRFRVSVWEFSLPNWVKVAIGFFAETSTKELNCYLLLGLKIGLEQISFIDETNTQRLKQNIKSIERIFRLFSNENRFILQHINSCFTLLGNPARTR